MARFCIGSDHAAIELRRTICTHLRQHGHDVTEVGPSEGQSSDYPEQAGAVAWAVARGEAERGVLVCGTGIGMSIAANKVPGIRAALVHDTVTAELAAMHNKANVLCIGGRLFAPQYALKLVDAWLETEFEERHQPRLDKITALEGQTQD